MSIDKSKFEITKEGSVATVTYNDEDAFYEGSDISKKVFKEVFDHSHDYVEKVSVAAADQATEIMANDKDIDDVSFTFPYGVSKRGKVNVNAKRSTTFRGIGDRPDVTRSDLRVAVSDPLTKMSKTKLKDLQAKMTEELLG